MLILALIFASVLPLLAIVGLVFAVNWFRRVKQPGIFWAVRVSVLVLAGGLIGLAFVLPLTLYEIVWLAIIPGAAHSWYFIVRNWRRFVAKAPSVPAHPATIVFLFAARNSSRLLQNSIDSVHQACAVHGYADYRVMAVLAASPTGIPLLDAEVYYPPAKFVSRSKYKGRQLQFMLKHLPNDPAVWVHHLDEDAQVLPQTVASILAYTASSSAQPIANGPSSFPPCGNFLTFLIETHRQWTFFWLRDQVEGCPVWLNGSNLLVRSDVEHAIGWNADTYLGEDAVFGLRAQKALGPVFGWHGGLTIEQPPAHLKAVFVQRKRWYCNGMLTLAMTPAKRLPRRIYSLACWTFSLVLTVSFFVSIGGYVHTVVWLAPILYVSRVPWIARHLIGIYWNLKYVKMTIWRRAGYYLGMAVLTPLIDLLAGLPSILCLVNPPSSFQITTKTQMAELVSVGRP